MPMEIDQDKVDQAFLALLLLGRHEGNRTWKAFDWEVMAVAPRKNCARTKCVGPANRLLLSTVLRDRNHFFESPLLHHSTGTAIAACNSGKRQ